MEKESLHFKIGLIGEYWDKKPAYTILINDDVKFKGTIQAESGKVEYAEFDADIESGNHVLQIRLENKEHTDTLKDNYDDPHNYKIIGDMLLNIESIEIDEIDTGSLKWVCSEFILDNPIEHNGQRIESMQNCTSLGMNGAYKFKFESPFYLWLLENL